MREVRRSAVLGGAAALGAVPFVAVPMVACAVVALLSVSTGSVSSMTRAALGTLVLVVVVVPVGTAVAAAATLVAATSTRAVRRVVDVAVVIPVLVPPAAVGVAVLRAVGHAGWAAPWLPAGAAPGFGGLALATVVAHVPLSYIVLRVAMRSVDARTVEAARVAGFGGVAIARRILLGRLRPALVLAATTLAVATVVDPSIAAVVRGRHATLAWAATSGAATAADRGTATVAAMIVTLLLVVICLPALRAQTSTSSVLQAVTRAPSHGFGLEGPIVVVARAIVVVHGVVVLLLASTLAWLALTTVASAPGVILADVSTIAATVAHAAVALAIAVLAGAATARLARSSSPPVARGIDRAHLVVAFVPVTAIGVGTAIAYGGEAWPLPALVGGAAPLGGSIAIVAMLVVVCQPLAYAASRTRVAQLTGVEVDAARVAGADGRRVAALVASRTRVSTVAFAAALVARAIVTVVPVVQVSSPTMPLVTTRILDAVDDASWGVASAVASSTAVAIAVLVAVVWASLQVRALPTGVRS